MSSFREVWKVAEIKRHKLNDELYDKLDVFLKGHTDNRGGDTYDNAVNAKMLVRELVDNIYRWNEATSIVVEAELKGLVFKAKVKHNGTGFNPFDDGSNCPIIKGIHKEIGFTIKEGYGMDATKTDFKFDFNLKTSISGEE